MAIQLPNAGLGDGQTGDNEFVMWTKVKNNFSNQTHAANRLVGLGPNNIPDVSNLIRATLTAPYEGTMQSMTEYDTLTAGDYKYTGEMNYNGVSSFPDTISFVWFRYCFVATRARIGGRLYQEVNRASGFNNGVLKAYRIKEAGSGWSDWHHDWTTANTTKEEGTGYLVASSPVLKMQHDSFEKVHEAEQLDIEVKNIKTGVYEITGTTGLREDDGWNLRPPKDINGNVLCICEASEKDGVITLNTYAKRFDFETVSIVADYEQPTDIPEGAVVMLRFNDLPEEQLDEPIE